MRALHVELAGPVAGAQHLTYCFWNVSISDRGMAAPPEVPDGDWIDYATRAMRTGGRWHRRRPPEQAPFFVRFGTLLPVDPGPVTSSAADPESLAVEVWGAEAARVLVHEHAGRPRSRWLAPVIPPT